MNRYHQRIALRTGHTLGRLQLRCNRRRETKSWIPQKGIKVEAMIGPNETWRMGVIVKMGKSQKWCHIYDEREKRLVRKVPMEYIREPLVPGEDPRKDQETDGGENKLS